MSDMHGYTLNYIGFHMVNLSVLLSEGVFSMARHRT